MTNRRADGTAAPPNPRTLAHAERWAFALHTEVPAQAREDWRACQEFVRRCAASVWMASRSGKNWYWARDVERPVFRTVVVVK